MTVAVLPHPLKLLARLLFVSIVVIWTAHSLQRAVVEPLLPALRWSIEALEGDFTILSVEIAREGPNETVRMRANFAKPIYLAGKTIFPFGWRPGTEGWMEVNLTLGGILQYAALMIIVVLAWPGSGVTEFGLRVAILAPLTALLLILQVPFTFLAEFWFPVHNDIEPEAFWPLLTWSRFLMGGGGVATALLFATVSIIYACQWSERIFGHRRNIVKGAQLTDGSEAANETVTQLQ